MRIWGVSLFSCFVKREPITIEYAFTNAEAALSAQNENVRFVQSRNVRFHGLPRGQWKRSGSP
jgi:hypothetical protein